MRNKYSLFKRNLLVAAVAVGCVAAVSCLRDEDLEAFRHPIHIEGNISPSYAFPLANGQMSFGDLLSNLPSDFTGYIDKDSAVITIKWDGTYSDTIYPLSDLPSFKSNRPLPKDENLYRLHKDTIIRQSIPIPLFDNADLADMADSLMALKRMLLSLTVAAKAEPAIVAEHVRAEFSNLLVTYIDRDGITRQFDPLSDTTTVTIDSLTTGLHHHYNNINIANLINSYPRQIDVEFQLKLGVLTSIDSIEWESYSFRQMMDSIRMTRLMYTIGADLKVPFDIRVNNFSYTYDLDLGGGLSSFNFDSIISQLHDSLHVNIDSLRLQFDFYNHIPLELKVAAWLLDEDSVTLSNLFDNHIIRIAKIREMRNFGGSHGADDTTYTALPLTLKDTDIDNLKRARILRLKVGINSYDQFVVIRREDYMRFKLSLVAAASASATIPL